MKYVDFYFTAPDEDSFRNSMADFDMGGVLGGMDMTFDLDVKIEDTPATYTDEGYVDTPATFVSGYHANIRAVEPSTSLKSKLRANPYWLGDKSQSGYKNGNPPVTPAREFA